MKSLDVSTATRTHNTAFVSSIRTYGNLGPFRPVDRSEFKGIRLFDMLLRPDQVVCGSTIREGDSDETLYGNWGVVIGSGDIQQAFPYDAASYVTGGRAISPYGWRNEGVDVETQVARAIEYRSGYNEVDIQLGQRSIAGIFFGNHAGGVDGIDLPSENVLEMIRPLDIPSYKLQGGQFYLIHSNGDSASRPTPPAAIIEHETIIPEDVSENMKHILAERLLLPPRNAISAGWQFGRMSGDNSPSKAVAWLESILASEHIDQRYFGSMAVYAARLTALHPATSFSQESYEQFVQRILPNGSLRASKSDIDFYLATGNPPEHFGKI